MSRSDHFNFERARRWFDFVKRDHWWRTQMPVVIDRLDNLLGLGSGYINRMLSGHPDYPPGAVLPKLARMIPEIERRRLVFPKRVPGPGKRGEILSPLSLWLEPPEHPPAILRLSTEAAWSLHAVCRNCGGNKFLPVEIDGKGHAACYHCLPPPQHRVVGAKPVKKSLIHEALKKHY